MEINIEQIQHFHGHMCPGLAIGIRVAEKAISEMGERPGDEQVVALVETDNCAVDAIQFITGCTFGKGNLIHLDYGKNAFRFIRRKDGKAIRIVVIPDSGNKTSLEEEALMERVRSKTETEDDRQKSAMIRQARIDFILSAAIDELVEVQQINAEIPARARIFNSVACDQCNEKTMETRLRLLGGKKYCTECFNKIMAASSRYD